MISSTSLETNVLSILTPLLSTTPPEYITKAWRSIEQIELPDGWNWEWIIQQDGPGQIEATIFKITDKDPRISFDHNDGDNPFGAAITRTAAFVRAQGSLIISLDADDYFISGGISSQIEAAEAHPECSWITGQARRIIEGQEQPRPCPLQPGLVEPGAVRRAWLENNRKMPVLATPVMYRAEELWRAGGWPALARSEDVSLLFAVSAAGSGWLTDIEFYAYRKWPGQTTWEVPETGTTEIVRTHRHRWAEAFSNQRP